MKKETHPSYQKVLFVDSASGHRFVCGSTLQPEGREVFEGIEYPVSYLSVSSFSHPLFTGSKQFVDAEGRVEKFKKRFERKQEAAKKEEESPAQQESGEQPQPRKKGAAKKPAEKKVTKPAAKKS